MEKSKLTISAVNALNKIEYNHVHHLIIDIWRYRDWADKNEVLPLSELLLDEVLLTSSQLFVVKYHKKTVGMLAASLLKNSLSQSYVRLRKLTALSQLVYKNNPEKVFDFYLETLKLNERLLQKCNQNFDASLNFLILDQQYHGLGIGNELYRLFISYLTTHHASNFYLFTDSFSNYVFYEKQGLTRIAEQQFSWSNMINPPSNELEYYYLYAGNVSKSLKSR
ncbi:GNAT family N-acetyltransferase [Lactiplantibacillus plantarum]|uniref:GNAT family N-acetyltransferase n=1 Tax=Lactiplantibacillus plantarum TaxID=1590 RepID=UPI0030954713